jgi:hypothetical protein
VPADAAAEADAAAAAPALEGEARGNIRVPGMTSTNRPAAGFHCRSGARICWRRRLMRRRMIRTSIQIGPSAGQDQWAPLRRPRRPPLAGAGCIGADAGRQPPPLRPIQMGTSLMLPPLRRRRRARLRRRRRRHLPDSGTVYLSCKPC